VPVRFAQSESEGGRVPQDCPHGSLVYAWAPAAGQHAARLHRFFGPGVGGDAASPDAVAVEMLVTGQ